MTCRSSRPSTSRIRRLVGPWCRGTAAVQARRLAGATLLCVVGILATGAPAAAQGVSTAGLRGRVVDTEGLAVEGAFVNLLHSPTGATSTALTDAGGRYYVPNQRPGGPYELTVSRIGFGEFSYAPIQLLLGQYVDFDVTLVSEALELEELVVEVEQDLEFNPGRIGLSTLVTRDVLEELPTLTRNFIDFAALSPLARVSEEGVSIVGTNYRFNNLRVDGALNQDVFGLSTNNIAGGRAGGRVIPLDAIEQFQVLVSPFDVRQSGFTGGVLNAVTKSGTNEFEGSVFGFLRDDALVGELVVDDVATVPAVSTEHGGFTFGGPIKQDKAHFFLAGEWERIREPPTGFHVGESDPFRLGLAPDSVARLQSLLTGLGADPGLASSFTLENTIANLFARVDWEISDRHDAMFRYSFSAADDDPDPNRLPGDAYELSSAGSEIRSRNHSAVFQFFSKLGDRLSNEFTANVQFLSEQETARSDYPRVEVNLDGHFDDEFITRDVRAGANFFAQENALEQRVIQLANNLTYATGGHQFLVGVSGTWFDFDRRFVPSKFGSYEFDSLADFELNLPDRYEITIPLTKDGSNPEFGVRELAFYAQDEWAVSDALTLRVGLRLDIPMMPGGPVNNDRLESLLGIRTAQLPGGHSSLSPRAGLNWRPATGTQVRVGVGVFTGRPAFSWLSNAYQNNGLAATTLVCRGPETPGFSPTVTAPTECLGGPDAGESLPVINYFDPEFRFPQDLRTMFAFDQRLPGDLVLSASWIYNRSIKQIFIHNENLRGPPSLALPAREIDPAEGFTDGFGFGVRHVWGDPTVGLPGGNDQLWEGSRATDEFGSVLQLANRDDNITYAASFELKRNFGRIFGMSAGYSYTRSSDLQSLTSLDVTSNYASTPVDRLPNVPRRQRSLFDRPHKLVANAFVRILPQFGGTEISLLYVGQSGVPYSYVYLGDVNGDGFNGPRASDLGNDLLFIPDRPASFPGSFVNQALMAGLLKQEECLREQVLRVMRRNSCETPWSNRIDLRISQNVRARAFNAEVSFDLLNVLNFFDSTKGIVHIANPVVQVFRVGRFEFPPQQLKARYIGPTQRNRETGGIIADRPFAPEIPTSQWRAQLGVRLSFGSRSP